MTSFAVMQSELGTVFSDTRALLWQAAVLVSGPLLILLLWPSESLLTYLNDGQGPRTLAMIGTTTGIGLALLSGGFALDQVPGRTGHAFVHWYRYTPAASLSYLGGRLLFHLVHSLLLTLMILPSLAVAAIPSRATAGDLFLLAAYIVYACFCLRAAGEAGRDSAKFNPSAAFLGYFLLLVIYLIVSYSRWREWSLVSALLVLSEPSRDGPSTILKSSILLFLFAFLGSGIAVIRLFLAERIEKAGGSR